MVWPISIFKSYPEIDGGSLLKFASSYQKVANSGDPHGQEMFHESIGLLSYYYYAEENPSIKSKDLNELMQRNTGASAFFSSLLENDAIRLKMADHLDGMTFGDVVSERDDIKEDLVDLLEDRDLCVANKPINSDTPPRSAELGVSGL